MVRAEQTRDIGPQAGNQAPRTPGSQPPAWEPNPAKLRFARPGVFIAVLIVFLALWSAATVLAAESADKGSEAKRGSPGRRGELLHVIHAAVKEAPERGAPRAANACKELFSGMSERDLRATATTAPWDIALHAMWQLRRYDSGARFDPERYLSPIRHLEEQTKAPVPAHWALEFWLLFHSPNEHELNRVLEYYYHRDKTLVEREEGGLRDLGVTYALTRRGPNRRGSGLGFTVNDGIRISLSRSSLRITQGDRSVVCDAGILPVRDGDRSSTCHCAAVVGPRLSFVAFYEDTPKPYPLYCIDTKSGRVRWNSTVWSIYPTGVPYYPSGPPLQHEVRLSVGEDLVSVFGSSLELYAETFKTDSGKVACRFSTHGWDAGASRPLELVPQNLRAVRRGDSSPRVAHE